VDNAYLPFNYILLDEKIGKGWDYDVFNYLGELMNFVPIYVPTMHLYLFNDVINEKIMIAANGISKIDLSNNDVVDPESFDLSDNHFISCYRILVKKNNKKIKSFDDLKNGNYIIGVTLGTLVEYFVMEHLKGKNIVEFGKFDWSVNALITGEIDAVFIVETAGLGYNGHENDKV